MTIEASQIDFMNYSRFFKDDYRKGLYRFKAMLADPAQYQALIDNPISLSAAIGPDDVQTPKLCDLVRKLGKEKREAMVNAYAALFGHSTVNAMLNAPNVPLWQKKAIFRMSVDALTKDNLVLASKLNVPIDNWIGKTVDLGTIQVQPDRSSDKTIDCHGEFTIIDTLHDNLSDGSGKATYTLCVKDGYVLSNIDGVSGNRPEFSFHTSLGNSNLSWASAAMREQLAKSKFVDSEINSLIKTVTKESYNAKYTQLETSSDKFWIPSLYEMTKSVDPERSPKPEGEPYPHLLAIARTRGYAPDGGVTSYWLRSRYYNTSDKSIVVIYESTESSQYLNRDKAVPLCFCL